MKNVNTRVGLSDGIVQKSQAVYETVSGSNDLGQCYNIICCNPPTTELHFSGKWLSWSKSVN